MLYPGFYLGDHKLLKCSYYFIDFESQEVARPPQKLLLSSRVVALELLQQYI